MNKQGEVAKVFMGYASKTDLVNEVEKNTSLIFMQDQSITKVKLFLGLIFNESVDKTALFDAIKTTYGASHFESDILEFSHTKYYENEMGTGLKKQFVAIDQLIPVFTSYETKIMANEIENHFSVDSKRVVNIDPGILSAHNVILCTTKN